MLTKSHVCGSNSNWLGKVRTFAIDDRARRSFHRRAVSGQDCGRQDLSSDVASKPLQSRKFDLNIHIPHGVQSRVRPSCARQRQCECESPHEIPSAVLRQIHIARFERCLDLGESRKLPDRHTYRSFSASLARRTGALQLLRRRVRLDISCGHPHGLNEAWSFAVNNALRHLLDYMSIASKRRFYDVLAGSCTQSQQRADFHFDVDKPAERLTVERPKRTVEAHLKGDSAGGQPVNIRPVHFSSKSQRAATSSIALNAKSSKPSGTATLTSQLCRKGQSGPAIRGRWKLSSKSSSFALKLAATRSSSSRISSAVCGNLLKALTPANADRA